MTEWRLLLQEPGTDELVRRFREVSGKARRVRIASAFVSPFAARALLDEVPPGVRSTILVGRELSRSQVEGIQLLRGRAEVRIWIGGPAFHPKMYLLEAEGLTRVILGSSNFTGGGFSENVEANVFADLPSSDPMLVSLLERFDAWAAESAVVTEEWMSALRQMAAATDMVRELVEGDGQAIRAQAEMKRLIAAEHNRRSEEAAANEARAFAARPYFRSEHFAAFAPSKHRSEDATVVRERKAVSQRFLDLHQELMPRITAERWDLHPHHKAQNTTSSWHLVPEIVPQISAMWLSYGRSHARFKELMDREADDVYGFFNHAKLQILIDESMLRFGLMIAQRNNPWDRDYLQKKLGLIDPKGVVVEPDRVAAELRNAGTLEPRAYLEREAHGSSEDRDRVPLITLEKDALLSVVRRDDRGHWLGVWVDYTPTDPAISEGAILETTTRVFTHFYPCFDLLAWYPKKR